MYSNTKKNLLVLNLRETKDDTNVYIFQKKQVKLTDYRFCFSNPIILRICSHNFLNNKFLNNKFQNEEYKQKNYNNLKDNY